MNSSSLQGAARQAGDHPALEAAARVGYAVSGLLHLLIAWIALQVAWTRSSRSADQSGALQSIAGNTAGRVTLWVAVLGFLGLAVWQVAEAVGRTGGKDSDVWGDRVKSIAKAVVYLTLSWTSFGFARGGSSSSTQQTSDLTAKLLQQSGGRVLVAIVGLVVIGVGGYHVHKGATKKFLEDLVGHPGALATRAGMVGYCAKGVALAIVGGLFLAAARTGSAAGSTGLDGALHTLRGQPFGAFLLTAVALGLAAYGVYSFARAKCAKV